MVGLVVDVAAGLSSTVCERDFNSSNLGLFIIDAVFELFGRGDKCSNLVLEDDK